MQAETSVWKYHFPTLSKGTHQTSPTLYPLLYRGGARALATQAAKLINAGHFGPPLEQRRPLVQALHDELSADVARGLSRATVLNSIVSLRTFFSWADQDGLELTKDSVAKDYQAWIEALLHRVRIEKTLSSRTAYGHALYADRLLSRVLGIRKGLRFRTRLRPQPHRKHALGTQADKLSVQSTLEFGHMLLDISSTLTREAICGALPVHIQLRNGSTLTEWALVKRRELVSYRGRGLRTNAAQAAMARSPCSKQACIRTRHPLINLRIECELLIFLAQTGMNLAQAIRLRRGQFSYRSIGEDVLVFRSYKRRRGGEVEFRVYRGYRTLFERYLHWLDDIIPATEDSRLFPFVYPGAIPADGAPPRFEGIRKRCNIIGTPWIGPQRLRKARVNWLLRHTQDLALIAEHAQHSRSVLQADYELPHHQTAAAEIAKFHRAVDPSLSPPAPGACVSVHSLPGRVDGAPAEAPEPDCLNPGGCMFCTNHRDLDSADYVWSLASYRHLKLVELSMHPPSSRGAPGAPPAAVVDRLTAKLDAIAASSASRRTWVDEASSRVREETFHPIWAGFIECMDLS
jgi:hypothetical protein